MNDIAVHMYIIITSNNTLLTHGILFSTHFSYIHAHCGGFAFSQIHIHIQYSWYNRHKAPKITKYSKTSFKLMPWTDSYAGTFLLDLSQLTRNKKKNISKTFMHTTQNVLTMTDIARNIQSCVL